MNPTEELSTLGERKQGCLSPIVAFLYFSWISLILFVRFLMEIGGSVFTPDEAVTGQVSLPLAEGLAILLPGLFLALFWRNRSYRDVFLSWCAAGFFVLLQIPAHLTGSTALQPMAAWHIGLSLVFTLLVLLVRRLNHRRLIAEKSDAPLPASRHSLHKDWRLAFGLFTAGAAALPWLAWGALGSFADTLFQILAGLSFGLAAAVLLESTIGAPLLDPSSRQPTDSLWAGFACAVTLGIMASGLAFNFGVMQVLLVLILAPLAWVWSSLRLAGKYSGTAALFHAEVTIAALLVGLVTALPISLFDPNELALIIGLSPGEILGWAIRAASISFLTILIIALLAAWISVSARRAAFIDPFNLRSNARRLKTIAIVAAAAWLFAVAIYLVSGQPGYYGDRIFVILREQADLTHAAAIKDYSLRRQEVYLALTATAVQSQSSLRSTLDRLGIAYQPYYLVNGLEVPNNPLLRAWLTTRPEVEDIVESPRLRPLVEPAPPASGWDREISQPEWNLTLIKADRVWNELGVRGAGIIIGQSDSGVQWDHPDLQEQYRGNNGVHNYNWLDPWTNAPAPFDQGGHGTHTLGTILGKRTGVAPDATWIACANLNRNLGNPALYLDCMQFMLAPYPAGEDPFLAGRPEMGAMVLNNSWGCPILEGCEEETLQAAVYALRQAGLFVVASAGNDGPACSSLSDPLAIYPDVFTVGAIDAGGELAEFSSVGPLSLDGQGIAKPDLLAPGVQILSTFPGSTYNYIDGTSMAGPHVAGVVALMWAANPDLIGDISSTEQILRETTQLYSGAVRDCPGAQAHPSTAVGYGILDAYQAVQEALKK